MQGSLRTVPIVPQNSDGTPVTVSYLPEGSSDSPTNFPIIADVEILGGITSFRFLEQVNPEIFNYQYSGCFNTDTWRGRPPRTLKILPVNGQSDDGVWYMNTYSIEYREDTHDKYLIYRDSVGQIPYDVSKSLDYTGHTTSGNGWKRLQGTGQANKLVSFSSVFAGKIDPHTPIEGL